MPDTLYHQVEGIAEQLHVSVADLLCQAAEQMVQRQAKPKSRPKGDWRFPDGRHLGPFLAPVEDWRLLANETAE